MNEIINAFTEQGYCLARGVYSPAEQKDMKHAYAHNLDGLGLWDLNSVQFVPEKWAVLGRLGHKQEVMDMSPFAQHLPKMPRLKMLSIAGRDFSHTEYRNAPGAVPPEMLSVFTGG